jgi:hypothetical protein
MSHIRSWPLLLAGMAMIIMACGKDDMVTVPPTVKPDTVPSRNGLAAYYPFNGGSTDTISGQGGDIDGAIPTTNRFGDSAGAYLFDGNRSRITFPSKTLFRDSITLAAWVYPVARTGGEVVRRGEIPNSPFALALSYSGDRLFKLKTTSGLQIIRKTGYMLNQWTFLVGTFDGNVMKFYIDGELYDTLAVAAPIDDLSAPIVVGSRLQLPADTFAGKIDDILIYNRPLSATDVRKLYDLKKQ